MEHEYKEPREGYIFRSKANLDDFSSALYLGEGRILNEWNEVQISVFKTHQAKQEKKMREEIGMI